MNAVRHEWGSKPYIEGVNLYSFIFIKIQEQIIAVSFYSVLVDVKFILNTMYIPTLIPPYSANSYPGCHKFTILIKGIIV